MCVLWVPRCKCGCRVCVAWVPRCGCGCRVWVVWVPRCGWGGRVWVGWVRVGLQGCGNGCNSVDVAGNYFCFSLGCSRVVDALQHRFVMSNGQTGLSA